MHFLDFRRCDDRLPDGIRIRPLPKYAFSLGVYAMRPMGEYSLCTGRMCHRERREWGGLPGRERSWRGASKFPAAVGVTYKSFRNYRIPNLTGSAGRQLGHKGSACRDVFVSGRSSRS